MLAETIDPVAIARAYAAGGAAAISVVTEPNYFQGDLRPSAYIAAAGQASTAERVHEMHHRFCPVYRSIAGCIDITTELALEPATA